MRMNLLHAILILKNEANVVFSNVTQTEVTPVGDNTLISVK